MKNVLVIDDEVDILERFEFLLEDVCDEVFTANSAADGIQILADGNHIHCIVCDVDMPKVNGIQFIKKIREDLKSKIPVIFYSGRADDQDMIESYKYGTFDYIMKPNFQLLEVSIKSAFLITERIEAGEEVDLIQNANETYKELIQTLID